MQRKVNRRSLPEQLYSQTGVFICGQWWYVRGWNLFPIQTIPVDFGKPQVAKDIFGPVEQIAYPLGEVGR